MWFEEVDEFAGMEEIRTINQSLLRGGENFVVFTLTIRRKVSQIGSMRKSWGKEVIDWFIIVPT